MDVKVGLKRKLRLSLTYSISKRLLKLEKKEFRAGLDFVLWELIGWLEVGCCKQNGGRFECQFTFSLRVGGGSQI